MDARTTAKNIVTSYYFWIAVVVIIIVVLIFKAGKKKGQVTNAYAGSIGTEGSFDPRVSIDELEKGIRGKNWEKAISIIDLIPGWKEEYIRTAYNYWNYKYKPSHGSLTQAIENMPWFTKQFTNIAIDKLKSIGLL